MKSNIMKLGNFIRIIDERNSNLAITNLQGVSISKEFVPSIANIIGTDLSSYKIVRTGQFAYGPVTSRNGDKVSIALLKGEDCIISSSYIPFEDYKPDELLPDYLMLWFMRPEFDRYARFMSNGSAREVFDWENMCEVEIPVPTIEDQKRIVYDYKTISERIAILQSIYEKLERICFTVLDKISETAACRGHSNLEEFMLFGNGKTRPTNPGTVPVYGGNGIMSYADESNAKNVAIVGRVGAYCGSVYIEQNSCWVSDNAIWVKSRVSDDEFFDYCLLKSLNLFNHHIGTGQQLLTQGILNAIVCPAYLDEEISDFNKQVKPIFLCMQQYSNEMNKLEVLLSLLLSKIAQE